MMFLAKITVFCMFKYFSFMMLSIFSCCVSMIGCCGKCCSCCVVVFLSIYKFKMFVFCFGSWFISVYFCGRNSRGCKSLGLDCHINK